MAEGDETILGPKPCTTTGVTEMGALMDTNYTSKNDTYTAVVAANGLQFWVIHIEAVA